MATKKKPAGRMQVAGRDSTRTDYYEDKEFVDKHLTPFLKEISSRYGISYEKDVKQFDFRILADADNDRVAVVQYLRH